MTGLASGTGGGFRQSMAWLHTWAGLTLGWILYFVFVTGTAGYFDTEIDRWMQPELPPAQTHLPAEETAAVLLERLRREAPGAERWFISLPVDRNTPYPSVFWQGADPAAGASSTSGERRLDGANGEPLEARDTGGGQLLYQMHWRLHYLSRTWSDPIIAFATLFMLVALVTGIVVHKKIFKDFFTFRPGKGQRSWLDAHNVLSVIALPFHLMITYSGLIFMGFSFMPLIVAAHYGMDAEGRGQFIDEVFDPPGLVEAAGEPAPLAALDKMVDQAETTWGDGRIRSIDIRNPGDRNARVLFRENIDGRVNGSGDTLVFDGARGTLLHRVPAVASPAKGTRDLLTGLHEGLFAGPVLRGLYFFSGLLGTGMVATGLVLWTVKRRQQAQRKGNRAARGLVLVEKLNVGTVAGLPVAIAAYFWANRLLPVEMAGRADWEAHVLFLVWVAMLIHAALRPTGRAWIEQLTVASLAFGGLPLLDLVTTGWHPAAGDPVAAGFHLVVLILALATARVARKLRRRHRAEVAYGASAGNMFPEEA